MATESAYVITAFCNDGSQEPTGVIKGSVVSANGEAIGDCRIAMYNRESKLSIGAKVDESGAFEMPAVPFGEYQVMVDQTPANDLEYVVDKRMPKKFRDRATSGLTVSVTAADEKVFDIELK